jgi:hypothetical protein
LSFWAHDFTPPPTISFSNIFAFGGGVWGGAALKGKGNGGGVLRTR